MKRLLLYITIPIFGTAALFSCNSERGGCPGEETSCPVAYKGEWIDYTGLDGCGWIIEVENGAKLEMGSFDNSNEMDSLFCPYNGKKIWISYDTVNAASICMVGIIPGNVCISER